MRSSSSGTAGEPRSRASVWDRYVRTAPSPSVDAIRASLWSGRERETWAQLDEATRSTILDQYKLYVEGADRISARRASANTFFVSLNTAILTAIGVLWQGASDISAASMVVPWMALLAQCLAWFWILRSYRQLNSAKYAVVGAMEEVLPVSPWWRAEWAALGQGRDPARYWSLSHVEQLVPAIFATLYSAGLVLVML